MLAAGVELARGVMAIAPRASDTALDSNLAGIRRLE
jgi:hypothetical protein